ncbi:MAG: alkaline phosphatase family protein [Methylococcales bacterium]|nr:alkaline phosphatase family protein [Methylococcales bacterium]
MTPEKRKVLLIGWDAADWKIINALVDQGKMPHTAALIERGVMGNLATLHPVLSPMLWTSIATGKRPFKHGVLGFSEPTPDGGGVQPVSQWSRKTKALWNILNQEGYHSHVIGWWPSHPVEAINGVMVSNHFHTALGPPEEPWPLAPGMIHPPRIEAILAELRLNPNELIPEQVLPFIPKALEIDQDKDRRLASVMKILAECTSVHAAATWAMANEPWDFMGVYYDAIDHFSHGFMKYHPPRRGFISERDFELYSGVVEAGYCFHDMMLGAMLQLAPDDVTVIICSDHGFHSDHLRPVQIPNEPAGPAIEHRDFGVVLMAGPGLKKDALIHGATLLDITPTILTLFGLPIGQDMDGKPIRDAFESAPTISAIPSWDAVAGDDARLSGEQQFDPITAKEAMDQLVALGYIEKLDDNREQAVNQTVRELRYNLAGSYMDAGRMADAAPILSELYDNEPGQYRFGVQLALCYRSLNQVAALRTLVEKLTHDRMAAAEQARVDLEALQQEQLQLQEDAGQLNENGGLDKGQLSDEVRQRYNSLQLLARFDGFDLAFLMAWVLAAEGDNAGALDYLKRAGQTESHRPGLYLQIGETCLAMHRWEEAQAAYRKALAIDPLNPHAHLGLARALLPKHENGEAAVESALDSVRLLYHNPMAHYVLGLGLMRIRQYFRAAEAMRTAVALNPNFERAHRVLARFYVKATGERDKAMEHLTLCREIRTRRKTQGLPANDPILLDSVTVALEADQEARQIGFDAAPESLVDKSAVPDDPALSITVVAGLPRSGTSMMMQMLNAGGISLLTDQKREADGDNPRGYYELEAATQLRNNREWLNTGQGKAVKIVAQLLPFLPARLTYRIVFMERNLEEILQSQQIMLDNLGRGRSKLSDKQLQETYRQQLHRIKVWLAKQPNSKVLFIKHHEVLADPAATAQRINGFLGGKLDMAAMATVVDPSLYRQRR